MMSQTPLLRSAQKPTQAPAQPQGGQSAAMLAKQVSEALSDPKLLAGIARAIQQGAPAEQVIAEAVLKTVHASVMAAKQSGVALPAVLMQRVVPTGVKGVINALVATKVIPAQAAQQLFQAVMQAGKEMFAEMNGETEGSGPGEVPGEAEPQGM